MQNICNFMNGKTDRQRMIHRLVSRGGISTQADLRRMLGGRGYRVDPATVSRDIRELGLFQCPACGLNETTFQLINEPIRVDDKPCISTDDSMIQSHLPVIVDVYVHHHRAVRLPILVARHGDSATGVVI